MSLCRTGEGTYSSAYDLVNLKVDDGTGNLVRRQFRNGQSTQMSSEGVSFEKTIYTTRMGTAVENTINALISLVIAGYDEGLNMLPALKFDVPIELEKIIGNVGVEGSVRVDDNLEVGGTVSGTGIVVNGSQLICGTVIRNIQTDPLPSTGVLTISTPGINQTMPAAACNGDGDAAVFTVGTVTIVPSGECISIPLSNVDLTTIRINYSYWKQL